MTTLFDPLKLGSLELPNRIIMAPLMNATITTIYAGANEIQLNLIAERALGMPR